MEFWTVVGVDTKATERNKQTGDVYSGVKYYLVGNNFDSPDPDRFMGECVSVLFLSNEDRARFQYDAPVGSKVQVAYNRWGRVSLFQAA